METAPISILDFTDWAYCAILMGLNCIYTWVGTVSLWCTIFCYETFTLFKTRWRNACTPPMCWQFFTWWWLLVTKTCSKLHIIVYIVVFLMNNHFGYTTIQQDGAYQKKIFTCLSQLIPSHPFLGNFKTKLLTLRWLMSYIYGAPILDVSRSHTTTQHSR